MKKFLVLLLLLLMVACCPTKAAVPKGRSVTFFVKTHKSNAKQHNKQARRKLRREHQKLVRQRKRWRQASHAAALERRFKFSCERRVFAGSPGY